LSAGRRKESSRVFKSSETFGNDRFIGSHVDSGVSIDRQLPLNLRSPSAVHDDFQVTLDQCLTISFAAESTPEKPLQFEGIMAS
jgi:hypothetical protein